MASVRSLGFHKPTALQHYLNEQPDPTDDATQYTWHVPSNLNNNGCDCEDELLVSHNCVFWSQGRILRKCFRFEMDKEPITHALLAFFHVSNDSRASSSISLEKSRPRSTSENRAPSKAIVVFLRTQAHIFFVDGTSHVIHMPFEVESACAAPKGIIIQRKLRAASSEAAALKFPKAPQNSFVSSHLTTVASPASTQQTFSTEALGRPKTLPLRLSSNIERVWEAPITPVESQWPRLVCLTDPLAEMGLVVTQADLPPTKSRRCFSGKSRYCIDPAEEILHIEAIYAPDGVVSVDVHPLVIAVTLNREANTYTVWRMIYLQPDDMPFARPRKPVYKLDRRQSSMQPGRMSGATTPIAPHFRESFGAPLPGKRRTRKSERHDKPVDIASTIQGDKDGGASRRQSRRVSSILARIADLSASQVFDGAKRVDSHASQYHRQSSGLHPPFSTSGIGATATSHLEAPVDDLLDELRSGGDFEGFHTMGIDDRDFEGLSQEILFSKIHSVSVESTNFRYSTSPLQAKGKCKVFVVVGSPFTTDEQQRNQVLIAIQDTLENRLQLLSFHLHRQRKPDLARTVKRTPSSEAELMTITWSHLRKAQNVIDSCKIVDGGVSMILVLSRGTSGHELSIQAPWSKVTSISLPLLKLTDSNPMLYPICQKLMPKVDREALVHLPISNIVAVANSSSRGRVDVKDIDGTYHQIKIQLEPTRPMVQKVLEACRSVLPASQAEHILAGWWSIMQWLKAENAPFPDHEWSCAVILIFVLYLSAGLTGSSHLSRVPRRHLRADPFASLTLEGGTDLSGGEQIKQFGGVSNSAALPVWMQGAAWEWMLAEDAGASMLLIPETDPKDDFISSHIVCAKQFMMSSVGTDAIGPSGYLPTALGRGNESRRSAAWAIFMALHILMEEQKLNIMYPEFQSPGRVDLRVVMRQIALWLKWPGYTALYDLGLQAEIDPSYDEDVELLNPPIPEPTPQFCILSWIQGSLSGHGPVFFSSLPEIYYTGADVSCREKDNLGRWKHITPRTFMFQSLFEKLSVKGGSHGLVEALHSCGFTSSVLETLPEAVLVPLQDAMVRCQPQPSRTWPKELLELINRSDVSMMLASKKPRRRNAGRFLPPTHTATWDYSVLCKSLDEFIISGCSEDAGAEKLAVIRSLFKDDRRLDEAKNLLGTSRPRVVKLERDPSWSDSQYLEKQKDLATRIALGTLAIPSGRGLLFFSLRYPLLTQKYTIQGFNLNCVVQPEQMIVGVDKSMYAEDKVSWAFFHQGVAGGLAISPQAKGIDTSWILYNKPGQDLSNRHAGFLLALGLNGHLKSVAKWVAFKYLTPKHTMTSIGLLLGLAASYLGTMDSLITRLLSVHVTRMLPRGAAELNLSPLTQTTGILGIGLLYANTQHRRMSEIMVSEIAHIDTEEEEEPLRSECYRLAAGFALGLINIARGADLRGLADMHLTETLLSLATSTKKVDVVQILDRAAAPAVVAIALIFMRTEDQIVARKIDVPDSILQFEYTRPDVLLLRTLAKNLILWSKIEPTFRWIRKSLPTAFQSRYRLSGVQRLVSKDLSFFAILAGLCFSIALRLSGSANVQVRDLLVYYLDQFRRICTLPAEGFDSRLARAGTSMALDTIALSASIVMAGTGDLVVLRRLRALHGREDNATTYGSHLAAHLAIGALFLGSGTKTFGSSPMATAALVMSFYPVWPGHVMDNRAHLQAARHFWTLAVEDRCLAAREVGGGVVSIRVAVKLKKPGMSKEKARAEPTNRPLRSAVAGMSTMRLPTIDATPAIQIRSPNRANSPVPMDVDEESCEPEVLKLTTPTLLPPLETIASIQTEAGPTFFDLALDFEQKPGLREQFAASGMNLYLRRRPGMENVMDGTIRALSSKDTSCTGACNPLEWLFDLDALAALNAIEQSAVLGEEEDNGSGVGWSASLAKAVDARLVLRDATSGKSREDLLGLKLLFAWEQERERRLSSESASEDIAARDIVTGERVGYGVIGDVRMEEAEEGREASQVCRDDVEQGNLFWLRSTVVDELKGKVYLGSQGLV